MPVDMAVQLYITHSPPLHSFLSSYEDYRTRTFANICCKPLRPCINTKPAPDASPIPPCRIWPGSESKSKKKVVFADSRGMSLTAVRIFSPSENKTHRSESPLQFLIPKLEGSVNVSQSRMLEFTQPAADYLDFRRRLMQNLVCLESCVVQGRVLTGTVKVRNLAFEKSVCIRITYDLWKSYREVECTYMNDVYGCRETDTFSFVVEMPTVTSPQNKVEFCISFTTRGQTHWDNNDGNNYSIVTVHSDKKDNIVNMEPFRQMRNQKKCSTQSTEWKSWGNIRDTAPYW